MSNDHDLKDSPASMRPGHRIIGCATLAAFVAIAVPAPAQTRAPVRERDAPGTRAAPPARLGFGADNDAQPGGVPGNAPFNNQLRKFTDPLGANGGR